MDKTPITPVTFDTAPGIVICDPVRAGQAPHCGGVRICHPVLGWCNVANLDDSHLQLYVSHGDDAYQSVWVRYDHHDAAHALWPIEDAAAFVRFLRRFRGDLARRAA